jgi:hypothetical protein
VAVAATPIDARSAATTRRREARPASTHAATIGLADASFVPTLTLEAPARNNAALLVLAFLLAIAYAGGVRLLVRRESWSRRRSRTAALASRRRATRRSRAR